MRATLVMAFMKYHRPGTATTTMVGFPTVSQGKEHI